MKRISFVLTLFVAVLAIGSCTKESAQEKYLPHVTDFTKVILLGDNPMTVAIGDSFTDPGFTATDKEEDVHETVKVSIVDMDGNLAEAISTDGPGMYTINYSAVSKDNRPMSVSRTVFVVDPNLTVSLAGTFNVNFESTTCASAPGAAGSTSYSACAAYYAEHGSYGAYSKSSFALNFTEIAPGIYDVNDIFGGWYNAVQGRGGFYAEAYGAKYATYFDMTGRVFLSADGTITLVSSYIGAWGDGVDYFLDGKYDDATKTVSWETQYAGSVGPINVVATR